MKRQQVIFKDHTKVVSQWKVYVTTAEANGKITDI